MCRRCGEPDKRPYAKQRRAIKEWFLTAPQFGGDGTTVPCVHQLHPKCPINLTRTTVEMDRLVRGGNYNRQNLVPSCGPCNRQRFINSLTATGEEWPDGCRFGPEAATA